MLSNNRFKKAAAMGSAGSGAHHWIMQRLTAVALIPLSLWFAFSFSSMIGADFAHASAWLASPLNASLLIAFLIATFYHLALGMQVVIEDYVHHKAANLTLLLITKLGAFFFCIYGVVAVLNIAS